MLNRIVALSANEQKQVRGNIKRVIIRRASGPVLIETDKSESIEVRQGDNIRFENVCSVMSITDLSGMTNRLVMVLVSDAEGDLTSAASAVEIANTEEIARSILSAGSCDISVHQATMGGTLVLSGAVENRRTAVISTEGPVQVAVSKTGPRFTVDGVLEHPASGELWAFGESVVEVLEYLN